MSLPFKTLSEEIDNIVIKFLYCKKKSLLEILNALKLYTIVIDEAQCYGCEICKQVCPFSAIEKVV